MGVSLDEDRAAASRAERDWGAPFRSGFDGGGWEGPVARAYGVRFIPCAVLVGPDGRILQRRVFLQELLPEAAAGTPADDPAGGEGR